jgi:hypothetical protein
MFSFARRGVHAVDLVHEVYQPVFSQPPPAVAGDLELGIMADLAELVFAAAAVDRQRIVARIARRGGDVVLVGERARAGTSPVPTRRPGHPVQPAFSAGLLADDPGRAVE